jgi:hypothetical protein
MPFGCIAIILPGQLRDEGLLLDGWIEDAWSKYVEAGTAFGQAHDRFGRCLLRLSGPGFLSSRPPLQPGQQIMVGTVVAYFHADGESIPYGSPYCTLYYDSLDDQVQKRLQR